MTSRCRRYFVLLLALCGTVLSSCGTPGSNHPAVLERNRQIAQEPRGDYYIGRRYYVRGTRFWGYLRRPGEVWDKARLVVMKETRTRQPDRVPEGTGPDAHGFDHNREYRIRGRFTGETVYDPNADLELPSFEPVSFELINPHPGFLFSPTDRYNPRYLPEREIRNTTPRRL